jgi:uncharacterized protein
MLRVSLSEARAGAVDTSGEIAPGDPLLAGAEWPLARPLRVRGRFSSAGEGKFFWRARAETALRAECRRCLVQVEVPLSLDLSLVFATGTDTPEGEGCYLIPAREQELDLGPALREEMLLAAPRYVECRPDCKGLCARCGANLNEGPCGCTSEADPRWNALRQLTETHTPKD